MEYIKLITWEHKRLLTSYLMTDLHVSCLRLYNPFTRWQMNWSINCELIFSVVSVGGLFWCVGIFWLTGIYGAVLLGYKFQRGSKNPFNFSHSSIFIWHHLIHLISLSISLQVVTKSTQRALIWKHIKEFILVSTQCLFKLRLHRICFMTNFDHNWY